MGPNARLIYKEDYSNVKDNLLRNRTIQADTIVRADDFFSTLEPSLNLKVVKNLTACLYIACSAKGHASIYVNEEEKTVFVDILGENFILQDNDILALSCVSWDAANIKIFKVADDKINIRIVFSI
jgi:hypothetical protein